MSDRDVFTLTELNCILDEFEYLAASQAKHVRMLQNHQNLIQSADPYQVIAEQTSRMLVMRTVRDKALSILRGVKSDAQG